MVQFRLLISKKECTNKWKSKNIPDGLLSSIQFPTVDWNGFFVKKSYILTKGLIVTWPKPFWVWQGLKDTGWFRWWACIFPCLCAAVPFSPIWCGFSRPKHSLPSLRAHLIVLRNLSDVNHNACYRKSSSLIRKELCRTRARMWCRASEKRSTESFYTTITYFLSTVNPFKILSLMTKVEPF